MNEILIYADAPAHLPSKANQVVSVSGSFDRDINSAAAGKAVAGVVIDVEGIRCAVDLRSTDGNLERAEYGFKR